MCMCIMCILRVLKKGNYFGEGSTAELEAREKRLKDGKISGKDEAARDVIQSMR